MDIVPGTPDDSVGTARTTQRFPGGRALLYWLVGWGTLGGTLGVLFLVSIPACPVRWVTGIPCPGCGMTRAAVALVQGRWAEATEMHPLVWVIVPTAGFYWLVATTRVARGRPLPSVSTSLVLVLGVSLSVVWALRLSGCWFPHPDWHG